MPPTICALCELLILRLHKPALFIILMYHNPPPPPCPAGEFNGILSRSQALILSKPSTLPNIIMLGDFIPFISLSDCIFLNQQVLEHTRKFNIIDIIFSPR